MRAVAKILVVEDEPLIRFTLAEYLLDEGYTVIECGNVLEALAALGLNDDIDAVVTDVDMPGALNGVQLAQLVQKTRPFVPVLVTSGRAVDLAGLEGNATFHPKPYDMTTIAVEIRRRLSSENLPSREVGAQRGVMRQVSAGLSIHSSARRT
ncbi:response regulator [Rhizobium cauense]|uniref:response regulator n=1 Tax=Rhizobium cauense TaxID=1166683 RepID=UPI001C6E35C7|nr:response regulator [Rhizobium cauense]MBW9117383.1 response regulator [Rhizobium cauense]